LLDGHPLTDEIAKCRDHLSLTCELHTTGQKHQRWAVVTSLHPTLILFFHFFSDFNSENILIFYLNFVLPLFHVI
jgi:hypothetical protein